MEKSVFNPFNTFSGESKKNRENMENVVDVLVDMGFPKERVELAVLKTKSQEVDVVMDFILTHEEELDATLSAAANEPTQTAPQSQTDQELASTGSGNTDSATELAPVARSIKCDDCGKLFKTNEEVEFHASKSGHENFSESTEEKATLTEEEKKEQLAQIMAKLKQRRLDREAREKEESLQRERARIKSGKELLEAKKKHEELEMKKLIEQRKKEKEEEFRARQRVKEQIEADKLARKAKSAGNQQQHGPVEAKPEPVAAPAQKKPAASYTDVKLQIRLLDGKALIQSFGAKEPLSAVRLYIQTNRTDGDCPFKLMTNFPKKIFEEEDYEKPLDSLGLAPSAILIVSRP